MTLQLVNPNLHVILIHWPIAMLFAGAAIELFAFLWPRSTFRAAGRWMILIGALASIPAITSGMYAGRQAMQGDPMANWADLKQSAKFSAGQWEHYIQHVRFNGVASSLLAVLVVTWLGSSDRMRQKAHLAFLLVLLVACGLISIGAWHGGELVFEHQTGANLVKGGLPTTQESGGESAATESPGAGGQGAFGLLNAANDQIAKLDNVVDVHTMLAGCMVALALVTLGMSIRTLSLAPGGSVDDPMASDDDIVDALAGRDATGEQHSLMTESLARVDLPPRPPAARFWLLVALLAIVTSLVGWMLAGPTSFEDVKGTFNGTLRAKAHIILGGSIIVLTLLLAAVTRFAPYNRVLVGCFSLLLATALAAQLWVGVLLLFDTSDGPLGSFNVATGH